MVFRRRLGEVPSFIRCCYATGKIAHRSRLAKSAISKMCFSSGSGGGYSAKAPSKALKSWESGAKLVQNTTVENKYLEHIREVHDPSQHLKTIEDELKGTIGKALGKQAQKILMYAKLMDQERQKYEELLRELGDDETGSASATATAAAKNKDLHECAVAHNNYRKDCLHARWELIVHRQAVGFTVGNHKFVQDKFPVGDELPVIEQADSSDLSTDKTNSKKPKEKQFTDQLDWWSRIGRWK